MCVDFPDRDHFEKTLLRLRRWPLLWLACLGVLSVGCWWCGPGLLCETASAGQKDSHGYSEQMKSAVR